MINKINDFIGCERSRFENKTDNTFSLTFSEISHYLQYLYILSQEYEQISKQFMTISKALQNTFKNQKGSNPMTVEQEELYAKNREITTNLHLKIESFYLFAKILLDKISVSIEFYFGSQRGLSLNSHDDLTKNIERYVIAKGIKLSAGFVDEVKKLKVDISDFRDYQIQHVSPGRRGRLVRATMWDGDGSTSISMTTMYPKEGEESQKNSRKISELISELESYIERVLKVIENNRVLTSLKLR